MALPSFKILPLKLKITKSDIWILLLCCVLTFPFMYADFEEYYQKKGLLRVIFYGIYSFVNPIIIAVFVAFFLTPFFLKSNRFFLFVVFILAFLLADALLCRFIAMWICGCTLKINLDTLVSVMQFQIMLAAPMAMILIIKQFIETQNQLLVAEKERKDAELKLLKQQIDPHFLFNNLNVLGALIQQDKDIAGEYLKRFASLYRYLIRHKDEDVVLLEDEWHFVEDYIYLLKQRFGNAYDFSEFQRPNEALLNSCFVPPASIQTLIENITKHNQGEETNPLKIKVKFDGDYLTIKNEIRSKFTQVASTQTGLKNLQTRYKLLSDKPLIITKLEEIFEVKVPLLKSL
jgi:two-component system, LytTR family, sensor kinase